MKYRLRVRGVEAMRLDGTPTGARAIISWLQELAPEVTVRERIEYRGWDDRTGHVELEIRGCEDQCGINDWIVLHQHDNTPDLEVLDDHRFRQTYEIDAD